MWRNGIWRSAKRGVEKFKDMNSRLYPFTGELLELEYR